MSGGSRGWWRRRIVDADLHHTEMVASTGTSTVTLREYVEDGRGGRTYWLVVGVVELALFAALPVLLLVVAPLSRPDIDWSDPFRLVVMVAASLVSLWCAVVWQSSVRAMVRARNDARREIDEDDEDDETSS